MLPPSAIGARTDSFSRQHKLRPKKIEGLSRPPGRFRCYEGGANCTTALVNRFHIGAYTPDRERRRFTPKRDESSRGTRQPWPAKSVCVQANLRHRYGRATTVEHARLARTHRRSRTSRDGTAVRKEWRRGRSLSAGGATPSSASRPSTASRTHCRKLAVSSRHALGATCDSLCCQKKSGKAWDTLGRPSRAPRLRSPAFETVLRGVRVEIRGDRAL